MEYNPKEYWEWRGREGRYAPDPGHEELDVCHEWLFREIGTVHTLLEIGAGTGRLINYFVKVKAAVLPRYYTAVDISASMADICEKNTGIRPLVTNGITLPFSPKRFDCVIMFYVLMHVRPEDLEGFFHEATRVSNDYLLVCNLYSPDPLELKPHNFNHDLPGLFVRHRVKEVRHVERGTNHTWLLKKY